jgi:hypothetical protein
MPGLVRAACAAVEQTAAVNGRTGMSERFSQTQQLQHWVQMLLGIFSAKGVLPLELKPAHSVGDLLT